MADSRRTEILRTNALFDSRRALLSTVLIQTHDQPLHQEITRGEGIKVQVQV